MSARNIDRQSLEAGTGWRLLVSGLTPFIASSQTSFDFSDVNHDSDDVMMTSVLHD